MAGKRKKGEGTVRLRKDGRWEGRVVVGYGRTPLQKRFHIIGTLQIEYILQLDTWPIQQYESPLNWIDFLQSARGGEIGSALFQLVRLEPGNCDFWLFPNVLQ